MKNPFEVLRSKEEELARVKEEVAALRVVARMLSDEEHHEDERVDSRRVLELP